MKKKDAIKTYETTLAKQTVERLSSDFTKQMDKVFLMKVKTTPSRLNQVAYSTVVGYLAGILLLAEQLKSMRDKAKLLLLDTEVDLQKAKVEDKVSVTSLN